jgi:hypothetical protein
LQRNQNNHKIQTYFTGQEIASDLKSDKNIITQGPPIVQGFGRSGTKTYDIKIKALFLLQLPGGEKFYFLSPFDAFILDIPQNNTPSPIRKNPIPIGPDQKSANQMFSTSYPFHI